MIMYDLVDTVISKGYTTLILVGVCYDDCKRIVSKHKGINVIIVDDSNIDTFKIPLKYGEVAIILPPRMRLPKYIKEEPDVFICAELLKK